MADLTSNKREELNSDKFAVPSKRELPMHDLTHAKLAWDMIERTAGLTAAEKKEARIRIKAQLKNLGEDTSHYGENETTQKFSCFFGTGVEVYSTNGGRRTLKIPVARIGSFVHPRYGVVAFSQADFDQILENFDLDEAGFTPYLRYGHSVFPDNVKNTLYDAEPKIGNLKSLKQEGDVLFGFYEPLGDKVVNEVDKGEYEGASAEVLRHAISKKDGRPIGTLLTSHALTNAPFVPRLPANQVLSENAGSSTSEALDMTQPIQGDHSMDISEMLSTLAAADLGSENLSASQADIEKIRASLAKLAGEPADPKMVDNDPPGEASKIYSPEKLSGGETVATADAPAKDPEDPKEKFSHGTPLKTAGKALEKMGDNEDEEAKKEKLSSFFGELLSMFGSKKSAKAETSDEAPAKAEQKLSQSVGDTTEKEHQEKLSLGSVKEGEESVMDEKQIQKMLDTAVSNVEQKFSTALAEKDQKIAELTSKVDENKTVAQQFSNSLVEGAFQTRVNGLVAAGVPAVVVHGVADIARNLRGNVQKLSNGNEVDQAEALFQALEKTPGDLRVSFDQVGQQLSQGGQSASAASVYGSVVPGLNK